MDYVLIRFDDGTDAYQEICRGLVQRICDMGGATIALDGGSVVIDASPAQPSWALPDPPEPAPPSPPVRRVTKNQFIDRLGDVAYVAILAMAHQNVEVEAFVKRLEMATPDADGTSVDLDDPRTVAGVTALGAALEAQGIVGADWASGVLYA